MRVETVYCDLCHNQETNPKLIKRRHILTSVDGTGGTFGDVCDSCWNRLWRALKSRNFWEAIREG